jgi:hypothetical protein
MNMNRNYLILHFGSLLLPVVAAASVASAASSFSNSLTGFTGNSTQPATQEAVAAAGFNFSDLESDTAVQFDASGAHFDALLLGNDGRNYVRTIETDYANVSFEAEITVVAPFIDLQDGYFGIGSGDANAVDGFRTPDWLTPSSSAMLWLEVNIADPFLTTLKNRNTIGTFVAAAAPELIDGTHRLRLSYDWFRKAAEFSIDLDYADGEFMADLTAAPVNVSDLYGADGWPTEPARIFFGGDEDIVFKDFEVSVSTPSMLIGDFNSDGDVTAADWTILRSNQHVDLSGMTHEDAYFLGDLTADLANNHADFVAFKNLYEAANGAGSFASLSAVPEPSMAVLVLAAGTFTLPAMRRVTRR